MEFWEKNFQDKGEMWGSDPAGSAISTTQLFKENGFKNVLIPGIGYGRNAKIFLDKGFRVTGIEISKTAIEIAKKYFNQGLNIYHGSINDMPLDKKSYDGIFCYSLIHLLNEQERVKLIENSFKQLSKKGLMVFIAISDNTPEYGNGMQINQNTFKTKHGIKVCYYNPELIEQEFSSFGLISYQEINELTNNRANKPFQKFWKIICRK